MLGFSFLAIVSTAGICLIIGIITSRGREQLLATGFALFAAAVLHNLAGYFFGYWGARLSRLSETNCRTVAMNVLHSAGAGLAAVVFGPWMNISGALLAEWWKRRPALVSNR